VKNLTLLSLLALATGFIMMMSCKKGDTGPAGPVGPDSVQYSNWTPLSMAGYIDANSDTTYTDTLIAKSITSAILSKGAVVGYLQGMDALGDTVIVNASSRMDENFLVGKIELFSNAPYASNSAGVDYTGYNYRYVVIPAKIATSGISGSGKTYTTDQLKAMSYSELTSVLNIPAKGSSLKLNSPN